MNSIKTSSCTNHASSLFQQLSMDREHTEMDHQDTPPPEVTCSGTSEHESVGEADSDHTRDSACYTPEGLAPRNNLGLDTSNQGTPNRSPGKWNCFVSVTFYLFFMKR